MADFLKFLPVLLRNEGGLADDPADGGGLTYKGVAQNFHPTWRGWPLVLAALKTQQLSRPVPRAHWGAVNQLLERNRVLQEMVVAFYKQQYWNCLRLDEVESQCIATQLADFGVNAGTSRPAKLLQYVLAHELHVPGIAVDGLIGRRTIAALNAAPAPQVYAALLAMRRAFHAYRAAAWKPAEAPALSAWHAFFHDQLKLRADASQRKFLASWLSRCTAPFVA